MVGPAPLKSDHSHLNMWRVYIIIVILAVCTTILCKPDTTVLPNELDAACFSCVVGPCVVSHSHVIQRFATILPPVLLIT